MFKKFASFLKKEEGQALAEYGLILALVAVATVVALTTMGTSLTTILDFISGKLTAAS